MCAGKDRRFNLFPCPWGAQGGMHNMAPRSHSSMTRTLYVHVAGRAKIDRLFCRLSSTCRCLLDQPQLPEFVGVPPVLGGTDVGLLIVLLRLGQLSLQFGF